LKKEVSLEANLCNCNHTQYVSSNVKGKMHNVDPISDLEVVLLISKDDSWQFYSFFRLWL